MPDSIPFYTSFAPRTGLVLLQDALWLPVGLSLLPDLCYPIIINLEWLVQRGRKMTDVEYQQWWQLHIRVARGEPLDDTEQALYRAGMDELDREEAERLQLASLAHLQELRNQVQRLTQSLVQLTKQTESLSSRIAALEQTYQQLTGYPLLSDANATS